MKRTMIINGTSASAAHVCLSDSRAIHCFAIAHTHTCNTMWRVYHHIYERAREREILTISFWGRVLAIYTWVVAHRIWRKGGFWLQSDCAFSSMLIVRSACVKISQSKKKSVRSSLLEHRYEKKKTRLNRIDNKYF